MDCGHFIFSKKLNSKLVLHMRKKFQFWHFKQTYPSIWCVSDKETQHTVPLTVMAWNDNDNSQCSSTRYHTNIKLVTVFCCLCPDFTGIRLRICQKKQQKTYASDGSFFYFKVNIHLSKIIGVFVEIITVYFLYFPSRPRSYFCSHLFCQPFILWLLSFYGNVAVTGSKKPHLLASQKTGVKLWQ